MPSKKEEWVEAKEAAAILTSSSGHQVSLDYVRKLAHKGKIRFRAKDGRTNEYYRLDIENYRVRQNRKSDDVIKPEESVA